MHFHKNTLSKGLVKEQLNKKEVGYMEKFTEIYKTAISWTKEAGKNIKESLNEQLHVEYKTSEADLVTEKDREIEEFFIHKIKERYPSHYIIGEEGMGEDTSFNPTEEIVWLIDPIDGTTSFVHQRENFAISVAVYEKGHPRVGIIYDPIREECYHALHEHGAFKNEERLEKVGETTVKHSLLGIDSSWLVPNDQYDYRKFHSLIQDLRGTRVIGSAALEMAAVASGKLNGFISLRLSPWDFAAGIVLLGELGVTATTIENKPINLFEKTSICAGNPTFHKQLMQEYLETE